MDIIMPLKELTVEDILNKIKDRARIWEKNMQTAESDRDLFPNDNHYLVCAALADDYNLFLRQLEEEMK